MRFTFITVAIAAAFVGVGCARDSTAGGKSSMTADACKMCPGVQTATAEGKCPSCGMAVHTMNDSGSMEKSSPMHQMPTTRAS